MAHTPTATTTRSRSAGTYHPSHPALKVLARCHHPDAVTPSLIAEGTQGGDRARKQQHQLPLKKMFPLPQHQCLCTVKPQRQEAARRTAGPWEVEEHSQGERRLQQPRMSSVQRQQSLPISGLQSRTLLFQGTFRQGPTHLPILLKMVMQHLGMRLLMCRQDVEKRGWSITRGSTRVQRPSRSESRGQAERRRCASVESLLVKRLHGRQQGQCQRPAGAAPR